jgi:hypothetical protein
MFGRGFVWSVTLLVLVGSARAAGTLKDDLAALEGAWISGKVKDADKKGTGTIKLQFRGAKDGALKGRGSLEVKTKRTGSTGSSTRTFTFRLVEKDGARRIVAPGPNGTGLSLTYRFHDGKLILSGEIVSQQISYNLKDVPLKRPATK